MNGPVEEDTVERRTTYADAKGFEDLFVHPDNREAVAACRAVAEGRWTGGFPITLRGPSACGKSHLLRAMEARLLERAPGSAVAHLERDTTWGTPRDATFLGDALLPVPLGELSLLLVEDLDLVIWPPGVRHWLTGALLVLRETGGRAVVTTGTSGLASRRPSELGELIASGRVIGLDLPAEPARREFIEKCAQRWGVDVPEEALRVLAHRLPGKMHVLQLALGILARRLYAEQGPFQAQWVEEIADQLTKRPTPGELATARRDAEEFLAKIEEEGPLRPEIPRIRNH
jgi:chromosomal replication initiation ATPase DnaA